MTKFQARKTYDVAAKVADCSGEHFTFAVRPMTERVSGERFQLVVVLKEQDDSFMAELADVVVENSGLVVETQDYGMGELPLSVEGRRFGHYYGMSFEGTVGAAITVKRFLLNDGRVLRRFMVRMVECAMD